MQPDLKGAQRRALQYWFVDGLAELGAGAASLLLAGLFWVQGSLPGTPLTNLLFIAAAFAGAFAIRWGMLRFRAHSTYPRSGYVKPIGWQRTPRATAAAVIATILILIAVGMIGVLGLVWNLRWGARGADIVAWMPLMAGVVLAFIFVWTGQQLVITRLSIMGLVWLLLGGALALSGLSDYHASAVLVGLVGLALIGSGLRTRLAYLRRYPTIEGDGP